MSWSFSAIGTPQKIIDAIQEESNRLTDQSKVEFDDAMPHLKGLVAENFSNAPASVLLNIFANGSGSPANGQQIQRSCCVKIERMYAKLLI